MSLDRLGPGPFKVVDMWDPQAFWMASWGPKPEIDGDDGRCACCGARITWRVVVHDEAGSRHIVMGRTCASKADLQVYGAEETTAKRYRAMLNDLKDPASFGAWAWGQRGYTIGCRRGFTLAQYLGSRAGKSDFLNEMVKAIGEYKKRRKA